MFGKKQKKEKYTIEEYQKIKTARNKRRFHFQPYPWPVSLAMGIPLIFFFIIILVYIIYIKTLGSE